MNGGRPKYSTSFATGVRAYPLKNSHKSYTLNMVHGDCQKWAVYLLSYANVYMLIPALSRLYSCNLNLVMATYWLFESKHCGILYYQVLFMQLGHQVVFFPLLSLSSQTSWGRLDMKPFHEGFPGGHPS